MLTYPQWKFRRRLLGAAGIFAACLVAVMAFEALAQVSGSRTVPVVWNQGDAGQGTWLQIPFAVDAGSATSLAIPFSTTNGTQGSMYSYFTFVPVTGTQPATGYLCVLEGLTATQTSDAGCALLDGGVGPFVLKTSQTPAPIVEFSYTPGTHDDGGYIVGAAHLCQ